MLPVETIGFDKSGGIPLMVTHRFEATADGQLAHYTDNNLRATVPPEGWEAYAEAFPACVPILVNLTTPTAPAAPEADAPAAPKADAPAAPPAGWLSRFMGSAQ